jgi:hydrogenase expression/formation protein HypC
MCLAIPGQLIEIEGMDLFRSGRVSFGGIIREVNLCAVPEAEVGDYLLVHVGMAIGRIDAAEARQVFDYLEQIDQLDELGEEPAALEQAPRTPSRRTGRIGRIGRTGRSGRSGADS